MSKSWKDNNILHRMKEGTERTFHLSDIIWDTGDDGEEYGLDPEEFEYAIQDLPEEDDVTIYLEDDEIDDWDIIQEKVFDEMAEMYGFCIEG